MTKTILIATASAITLAGCATPGTGPRTYAGDPRNPKVFVNTNGATKCAEKKSNVVVDQEPLYFYREGKAFPIIWHLQTPGYSFVTNSNIADPTPQPGSPPGEINSCRAGGRTMQCINRGQNSGAWKYTLSVRADDNCGNPPDLDPIIANDSRDCGCSSQARASAMIVS